MSLRNTWTFPCRVKLLLEAALKKIEKHEVARKAVQKRLDAERADLEPGASTLIVADLGRELDVHKKWVADLLSWVRVFSANNQADDTLMLDAEDVEFFGLGD